MTLDRLWAGWRGEYLDSLNTARPPGCVMCAIVAGEQEDELVIRRSATVAVTNRYPYANGHVLVVPARHVADLGELDEAESDELWHTIRDLVAAVRTAYRPDGVNVGANLGRAAGAGIPDHLHVHVVPRWAADTNFMTTVAGARVLPETLAATAERLRRALG